MHTNIVGEQEEKLAPNSLFFPLVTEDCPLRFYEKLVFAWQLLAENPDDLAECARYCCTDIRTVQSAIADLKHLRESGDWKEEWFIPRKGSDEPAYYVVTFRPGISGLHSCIFGLLASLKISKKRKITNSYIAKILRCDRHVIGRLLTGKKRVINDGEITVCSEKQKAPPLPEAKTSEAKSTTESAKSTTESAKSTTESAKSTTISISHYPFIISSVYGTASAEEEKRERELITEEEERELITEEEEKEELQKKVNEVIERRPELREDYECWMRFHSRHDRPEKRLQLLDLWLEKHDPQPFDMDAYLDRVFPPVVDMMRSLHFTDREITEILTLFRRMGDDWLISHSVQDIVKGITAEHKANGRPGSGAKFVLWKLKDALSSAS